MNKIYFTAATLAHLKKLSTNNTRDWFHKHQDEYERFVRVPALEFIADIKDELLAISPHFTAIARKSGGSLMRIQRDTRFSKNKLPYKTNIGIQFRHETGRNAHTPCFYLHIEPGHCLFGAGIWLPDPGQLLKIRNYIAKNPADWNQNIYKGKFGNKFKLVGETLIQAPRGFNRNHPLIDDIKRKDFIAKSRIEDSFVTRKTFMNVTLENFNIASDYTRMICSALNIPY